MLLRLASFQPAWEMPSGQRSQIKACSGLSNVPADCHTMPQKSQALAFSICFSVLDYHSGRAGLECWAFTLPQPLSRTHIIWILQQKSISATDCGYRKALVTYPMPRHLANQCSKWCRCVRPTVPNYRQRSSPRLKGRQLKPEDWHGYFQEGAIFIGIFRMPTFRARSQASAPWLSIL